MMRPRFLPEDLKENVTLVASSDIVRGIVDRKELRLNKQGGTKLVRLPAMTIVTKKLCASTARKKRHRISDCLKLKEKEPANIGLVGKTGSDDEKSNVCLRMINLIPDEYAFVNDNLDYDNIFIADSGASCNMIGTLKGMTDLIKIDESITVGNGQKIKATKMSTMNGSVKLPDGSIRKVNFQNC